MVPIYVYITQHLSLSLSDHPLHLLSHTKPKISSLSCFLESCQSKTSLSQDHSLFSSVVLILFTVNFVKKLELKHMEPPQHHHHHHQTDQESGNNNKSGSGGYTCRQTSTRWTPTTEQIKILKDLYYNHGVRSPTADQIQKITARLSKYGKIEGKNVFYWFQNHKARERQKKRFNGTTMTTTPTSSSLNSVMTANDHYHHPHHPLLHHNHGVPMQRPALKLDQDHHLYHQNKTYPSFNNGD